MRNPPTTLQHRTAMAAVLAVAVAVVSGCSASSRTPSAPSAPSAPSESVQHVTVVGNDDMRFVPDHLQVHAGTVQVTLRDVGSEVHNINFPSLHVKSPVIAGGATTSVTLHVEAHRTYNFDCDIHLSEGMVGTLTVVGAGSAGS